MFPLPPSLPVLFHAALRAVLEQRVQIKLSAQGLFTVRHYSGGTGQDDNQTAILLHDSKRESLLIMMMKIMMMVMAMCVRVCVRVWPKH